MISENIKEFIPKDAQVTLNNNVVTFEVSTSNIKEIINDLYHNKNLPLKLITATDERAKDGCFKVWYVFGVPRENIFIVPFLVLKDTQDFPSMVSISSEALNYEKKIRTFFGLNPVGHPDIKPILLHENWPSDVFPLRKDFGWKTRPDFLSGSYNFEKVEGEGIYEISVGPIHAGIIEPGHFRFSMAGEEIVRLEPKLGFVHKGSEKLFEQLALPEKIRLSEKISGDSSFAHSLAFCQAVEQLGDISVSNRASYLRTVYAELERLANHFGDIGAIMLDTGFNFGGSHGSLLREMIMQINERLTGSRFLRGVNVVGGVTKDISVEEKNRLVIDLKNIIKDFSEVIEIAENSISLLNRLKGTGRISHEVAKEQGIMGIAGRAAGISNDVRVDFPYAAYGNIGFNKMVVEQGGDVYARFYVRINEVYASFKIIEVALNKLSKGKIELPKNIVLKKNSLGLGCVEGWRGEIIYFISTDSKGNISRVAPRDPSFINWNAPGFAISGNIIADFPLINKSFNLSYSGNDL